jgi:hypothetical protein
VSYRRADTAAFWVLGIALLVVSTAAVAAALSAPAPWAWGAAAAALALAPALVRENWFEIGVGLWNLGVGRVAAWLRGYTLLVVYYLLLPAVGTAGSGLERRRPSPGASLWAARSRPDAGPPFTVVQARDDRGWQRRLLSWAASSGNRWVAAMLPLLVLLLVVRDEHQDSAPPSSTYTLY